MKGLRWDCCFVVLFDNEKSKQDGLARKGLLFSHEHVGR